MCGNVFKVNSVNACAPKEYVVKCGYCKECRSIEQNAWSFRLRCELEDCHSKGWKIGFCTLTFDDDHLPHIPEALIDGSCDSIQCFSKSLARDFIRSLRKALFDRFRVIGIKYMLVSEYGKSTKRCHHHAVFSWPPEVSAESFFDLIREKWKYGFIFPKNFLGGYDSHHYLHQPFEVTSNPFGCCKYIAKYVSKDLDFLGSIADVKFVQNADISDYMPFHLQSKSLGFSRFVGLSDDKKLEYITKGYSFVGESSYVPIPLYFKRKLFFSPKYIVERIIKDRFGNKIEELPLEKSMTDEQLRDCGYQVEYKRLVRRAATEFLRNNYEVLYKQQHQVYTKLFENLYNSDFLKSRGLDEHNSRILSDFLCSQPFFNSPASIADQYLCYYAVPHDKRYDVNPALQWFLRYDDTDSIDTSSFPSVSSDFSDIVDFVLPFASKIVTFTKCDYSEVDKLTAFISDFYKSAV